MCMCILRVIAGSSSPAAAQSATRHAHAYGAAARGAAWRVCGVPRARSRTASAWTKHAKAGMWVVVCNLNQIRMVRAAQASPDSVGFGYTWFKVPSKNVKSESGAERLGLVSMHAGEVRGAVLDLSGTLSSL
jgi:hypothetical protein